jgi:hypothetical protein
VGAWTLELTSDPAIYDGAGGAKTAPPIALHLAALRADGRIELGHSDPERLFVAAGTGLYVATGARFDRAKTGLLEGSTVAQLAGAWASPMLSRHAPFPRGSCT